MAHSQDYRDVYIDSTHEDDQDDNFTSYPVSHDTTPTNQRISEELRAKALSFGQRILKRTSDQSVTPPKNKSITPQRIPSPVQNGNSAKLDYKLRSQSLRSLREVTEANSQNN